MCMIAIIIVSKNKVVKVCKPQVHGIAATLVG